MCIIHDQKFACGCWRKPSGQSELTFCSIAHRNIGPGTNKPVQCHIDDCQAAIRPSIWYCLEHAPCKKFSGNYEALKANLSKEALAHVLDHGKYDFELKPSCEEGESDEKVAPTKKDSESMAEKVPAEDAEVRRDSTATTSTQDTNPPPYQGYRYSQVPSGYTAYIPPGPGQTY